MWQYYWMLGLRSLRRNPFLTTLMVLILGFGVAASMTAYTVVHVLGGDPMPHKSGQLFVPQLDSAPAINFKDGDEPDLQLTYLDAQRFLSDAKGSNRTAVYGVEVTVDAGRIDLPPTNEPGIAPTRGFFEIFEVPFRFGQPWSEQDDSEGAQVAVLGHALAEKLFGAEDPVGRSIKVEDRDYRIVGVLEHWVPVPRYYRLLNGNSDAEPDQVFVPFNNAVQREWYNDGWTNCNTMDPGEPGFAGFLKRECNWIQYWVELRSAAEVAEFHDYLVAHIESQRQLGRFPRPNNYRLRDLREWLELNEVVDADTYLQNYIAMGFLLVCIANVVGLLLAKFTARGGEIGVRRALGATRGDVIRQSLVEVSVIGLAGAVVGLLLSLVGLRVIDRFAYDGIGVISHDPQIVLLTLFVAVGSAVLAGLIPTWIASRQIPALQLKSQ